VKSIKNKRKKERRETRTGRGGLDQEEREGNQLVLSPALPFGQKEGGRRRRRKGRRKGRATSSFLSGT